MKAKLRTCPICKHSVDISLWKHFHKEHSDTDLTDRQFLTQYLNLPEVPKCIKCGALKSQDMHS